MKKFDLFSVIIKTSIAIVFSIAGGYISQIENLSGSEFAIYALVFFTIIFFIYASSDYLTGFIRKYISKNYIEGRWIQIIDDEKINNDLPPTRFTVLEISRENGKIKIHGKSYDEEGAQTTIFFSDSSKYSERESRLDYMFEFHTYEKNDKKVHFGKSILFFEKYNNNRTPNKYIGKIYSNLRDDIRVLAIKIDKNNSFSFSDPINRQKVISTIKEAFLQ